MALTLRLKKDLCGTTQEGQRDKNTIAWYGLYPVFVVYLNVEFAWLTTEILIKKSVCLILDLIVVNCSGWFVFVLC